MREAEQQETARKKLRQIIQAFARFRERQKKLKLKSKAKAHSREPSAGVYNSITIFTQNAISNNISIVGGEKTQSAEEKGGEGGETALRDEVSFYKNKTEELERLLREAKEKLKKYELSAA